MFTDVSEERVEELITRTILCISVQSVVLVLFKAFKLSMTGHQFFDKGKLLVASPLCPKCCGAHPGSYSVDTGYALIRGKETEA
jgi:hypothetical protein